MNLQELKQKTPDDLLSYAEELSIENASNLRKQEMMFAILKQLAANEIAIFGDGVLETLQDGFAIRRAAVERRIPCFTSLDTARAAAESLIDGSGSYNVKPLSEYLARR